MEKEQKNNIGKNILIMAVLTALIAFIIYIFISQFFIHEKESKTVKSGITLTDKKVEDNKVINK